MSTAIIVCGNGNRALNGASPSLGGCYFNTLLKSCCVSTHATFLLQEVLYEVESGSTFCNDAFLAIEQRKLSHNISVISVSCLTIFLLSSQ